MKKLLCHSNHHVLYQVFIKSDIALRDNHTVNLEARPDFRFFETLFKAGKSFEMV